MANALGTLTLLRAVEPNAGMASYASSYSISSALIAFLLAEFFFSRSSSRTISVRPDITVPSVQQLRFSSDVLSKEVFWFWAAAKSSSVLCLAEVFDFSAAASSNNNFDEELILRRVVAFKFNLVPGSSTKTQEGSSLPVPQKTSPAASDGADELACMSNTVS